MSLCNIVEWMFVLQFPDLASFLLARASRSTRLANYFYWYLSVECSEGKDMLKYDRIRLKFLEGLKSVSNHTRMHNSYKSVLEFFMYLFCMWLDKWTCLGGTAGLTIYFPPLPPPLPPLSSVLFRAPNTSGRNATICWLSKSSCLESWKPSWQPSVASKKTGPRE